MPRAAVAGMTMMALLGAFTGGLVRAADPDFSSVSDILGGQRYLLRNDDLVIGQLANFQRDVLLTTRLGIASQNIAPVVNAPCGGNFPQPPPFQTLVGRLFNLDHDVVVTLAPLKAAGSGCSGSPNMAFYIHDPHNPANDSVTNLTVSPDYNRIVLADFNSDGRADILFLNDQFAIIYTAANPDDPAQGLTEVAQLSTGSKPGQPFACPTQPSGAPFPTSCGLFDNPVIGDFNGDGALDVALPYAKVALVDQSQIPLIWIVFFASVCPAADAVVLGQTCTRAFQIVLSTQSIAVGAGQVAPALVLTAGNYAGAVGANSGSPSSQLVIAWAPENLGQSQDVLAVYSFDAKLSPALRSTLAFDFANSDQPLVATGRLGWFGSNDQVVFTSTSTGLVSVITFDEHLAMTPHSFRFSNGANPDPGTGLSNFSVGLAVGRFDPPDVNGGLNPNLQIARLGMIQNSFSGAAQVFLEIYAVDPAGGFAPTLASSFVVANQALFPLGGLGFPTRYGNPLSAGDLQARSLALGPPQKITVTGSIQPQVILGLPPMHIDFIQDANNVPNGTPTVLNLTAVPSKYFSQYQTQQNASNQSANTSTTSYTISTKESAEAKFSYGVPDVASVSVDLKASAQQTHDNTVATTYNTYSSQQFDVSTKTGFSDFVWYTAKRFNIYVYRVLGQCVPAPGSPAAEGCPKDTRPLYVQFSGPDLVTQSRIDGNLLEWYQPVQEPGNVFSYPWNAALLQNLYAGFNPLTADPATVWSTDSSGSAVSVSWSQGSGSSVTSGSVSTQSFDVSTTVSASAQAFGFGAGVSAGFDYNSSSSISTLNESSSTLGSSTGIKIVKPPFANPGQYAYAAQTYIFGQQAPAGTEQQIPLSTTVKSGGPLWTAFVTDPTDTGNGAGAWWAQAYTRPDVALNHPLRWTWTPPIPPNGDVMTFNEANPSNPALSEFYWMKGLYITPAGANGQGSQIVQAAAGDAISLQARVYNYSLADMPQGSTVHVRFYGQQWDKNMGNFTPGAAAVVIEEVILDPIPGFNSPSNGGQEPNWVLASTTLDTTNYADQYLIFWVVVWMEEQNGELVPEPAGHGLTAKPGPTTAPTAVAIERYSNNVGFYNQPFFVCPKSCPPSSLATAESLAVKKVEVAPNRVSIFENVTVSATLVAKGSSFNGVLVVYYDGDPQQGGEAFDAELIPHIRANDAYVNRVKFRPRTCGPHTVFVVAQGTATGTATVPVDCPPAGSGEFAGKAEQVGGGAEKGKVSFSGKVPAAGTLDLRVATVTVTALLREIGGGELVRGGGGAAFLPVTLRARRGSKATAAIFETPAGVRPSVEIEVKQRDPKKGEVEFSLKVDRATIPLAPKGCDPRGGNAVRLRTSIAIEDSSRKALEVNPELSWRCGRNELRTP
jgi:hypothetical protein